MRVCLFVYVFVLLQIVRCLLSDEALSQERERLDSSDDETSVVTLKLQMALLEQELMTSQRGQAEVEKEAENLKAEVASLQQKLKELKQEEATRRDQQVPLAPDAYYEEKVRDTRSLLGLQTSANRKIVHSSQKG